MTGQDSSTQKALAMRIAASANAAEKAAIRAWIQALMAVKKSDCPRLQKAKQAISVTVESEVVWPTVKIISREMKRLAWDDRSVKARFGLSGAAIAALAFGGQSAGIAALGTAVGVPLWVVFGAGATFLGALYEEITEDSEERKTTYTGIDAERKDD